MYSVDWAWWLDNCFLVDGLGVEDQQNGFLEELKYSM
jgi:hypothetical protein